MANQSTSDVALYCCKHLAGKFGYVVVGTMPHSEDKYPKGKSICEYANVRLFGWYLSVFAQTRADDFIKQCDSLLQNRLIKSAANKPPNGCRFFRCSLEVDDDIPF